MRLDDLFEDDDPIDAHGRAITGFWGNEGAGCLFYASDTKRFLVAHRSADVQEPYTWGTWGGAINRGESPKASALREADEECGYRGPVRMVPLLIFQAHRGGKMVFRFHNFLAIVPEEFTPRLNYESLGYRWCEYGHWPQPLHFGMQALLADAASVQQIQKELRRLTNPESNIR